MDQLRADVMLDLLVGADGHRRRTDKTVAAVGGAVGVVDIRVDLATLCRLVDHPGELAGYGPVIADIARRAAENKRTPSGATSLPTPTPDNRSRLGPPGGDPPPNYAASLKRPIYGVCFPAVAPPPRTVTSITGSRGLRVEPPTTSTSGPSAATTTSWSNTGWGGPTGESPAATTNAPAASATPTPPATRNHPEHEPRLRSRLATM
jgi:hypothetical protein